MLFMKPVLWSGDVWVSPQNSLLVVPKGNFLFEMNLFVLELPYVYTHYLAHFY